MPCTAAVTQSSTASEGRTIAKHSGRSSTAAAMVKSVSSARAPARRTEYQVLLYVRNEREAVRTQLDNVASD